MTALDAYVDLTGYVKPQDLAAGRVIMREAGLRVEPIDVPSGLHATSGEVLGVAARLYRGQVTNLRTEGGGFAAVELN